MAMTKDVDVRKSIALSRKIPQSMKEVILKFVNSGSRYKDGKVYGLTKPIGMGSISSKLSGVSFGADKDGFFVYTHRARSHSYKNPLKIPKKDIDSIESTG